MVDVVRVYEAENAGAGSRFLVDRLWPRGIRREPLRLEGWVKDVAPSSELRRWFAHDPEKWPEFKRRYAAELDEKPEAWKPILDAALSGGAVLLYGSKEQRYNNAVALKEYLEDKVSDRGT
jgi:uncharacterized protein YeaO (DUF488 family)